MQEENTENVDSLIKSFTNQLNVLNFNSKPDTPTESNLLADYIWIILLAFGIVYIGIATLLYFFPPKIIKVNKTLSMQKYLMLNVLIFIILCMIIGGGVYWFINF